MPRQYVNSRSGAGAFTKIASECVLGKTGTITFDASPYGELFFTLTDNGESTEKILADDNIRSAFAYFTAREYANTTSFILYYSGNTTPQYFNFTLTPVETGVEYSASQKQTSCTRTVYVYAR